MTTHALGSCLSYTTAESLEQFAELADVIRRAGLDGVLLGCTPDIPPGDIPQVGRILRDAGLVALQMHPAWPNLASADPATRTAALGYFKRSIDIAAEIGAETLIVHPGASEEDVVTAEDRRRAVDLNIASLGELLGHPAPEGLALVLENVPITVKDNDPKQRFGSRVDDIVELVEALDSARVGICLDTTHVLGSCLDLVESIRQAGPHLVATHLHDTSGPYDEHLMLGEGIIDWVAAFAAFREVDYRGPHVLEVTFPEGDLFTQLTQQREFVERLCG